MPLQESPERRARQRIDARLRAAGWVVQSRDEINLSAARGVAIREFKMEPGYGYADYLLFVDGRSVGALEAKTWLAGRAGSSSVSEALVGSPSRHSTLRARLQRMPPIHIPNLWPNKVEASINLERSLAEDRPRALTQMATGSGKTLLAVTALYRLIKFGGSRRVLFLVDRSNLGEQADAEGRTRASSRTGRSAVGRAGTGDSVRTELSRQGSTR